MSYNLGMRRGSSGSFFGERMSEECMLDLETLGRGNNALIISIGAIKFDPKEASLNYTYESFYRKVDPEDAQKQGLDIDASTVMWWLGREREARAYLTEGKGVHLVTALIEFRKFCGDIPVWGNGSTFDNVILKNAYSVIGTEPPWSYRNDRCYRTLAAICPDVKMERIGTYHNAVDDAKSQAIHLQRIYKKLGLSNE